MKTNSFLLLLPLLLFSCAPILKNTAGRVIHVKSQKQFQFDSFDSLEFDFSIERGLIVLQLSINKVDSLKLIFDSGAYTCFSENMANRMGGKRTKKKNLQWMATL